MLFVKRSMLIVCSLVCLASPPSLVNAQTQTSSETRAASQVEFNAEDALTLKALLKNLSSYQAMFAQRIIDAQGELLQESQGVMSLQKPNQLRWEVNFPDESLFVADGEVIYNLDPFVEQVTLMSQAGLVQSNPLMLLISDDEKAWDEVSITRVIGQNAASSATAPSATTQSLTTPSASEDVAIYKITASNINSSTQMLQLSFYGDVLQSLESVDRQQQKSVISFSDIEQNIVIAPSAFRVDVPDSYIVDDQR